MSGTKVLALIDRNPDNHPTSSEYHEIVESNILAREIPHAERHNSDSSATPEQTEVVDDPTPYENCSPLEVMYERSLPLTDDLDEDDDEEGGSEETTSSRSYENNSDRSYLPLDSTTREEPAPPSVYKKLRTKRMPRALSPRLPTPEAD